MSNAIMRQGKRNRIVKIIGNHRIRSAALRLALFKALSAVPQCLQRQAQKRLLLVSHRKKFVFIKIPLAASQSMEAALQLASEQAGFDLEPFAAPLAQGPEPFTGYFWFSFVRNPWARVVSCFHKKLINADSLYKLRLTSRYPGLHPQMPFDAFIAFLGSAQGADEIADLHWISQSKLLHTASGQRLCDEVRHLEDFEGCMDVFERATGWRMNSFPKKGSSNAMSVLPAYSNLRECYTPDSWEKVRYRYRADCVVFAYDMDLANGDVAE